MTSRKHVPRLKNAPSPGIVHLGLGAFFRSHGALVIEDALQAKGGDWGITGVSLRSPDIRDRLSRQEHVYTAVELGPEIESRRIVNVLNDVIFAPEHPEKLLARMADPATRVVSLTVTEKGYCHVPSKGVLDIDHPDIRHDIRNVTPRSAIGFAVRALQRRYQQGLRPFTVLSCDNLPNNGSVARSVVMGLASALDNSLSAWIEAEGRFPSTMVDRIVPATTEEGIEQLCASAGYLDEAPVFHEPFLQWVIEDSFVDGQRPAFEEVAGVHMVNDVTPFELMKLRMLNGTHSALAYLGFLAGYETIAETVADTAFRAFVRKLWNDEIIPAVSAPEGVNLNDYAKELLTRYENPAIRHKTWQIAMDGSQKLPQRILATIAANTAAGQNSDGLCLAVAAWMRYVGGIDENGQDIDVRDPLSARLRELSDSTDTPRDKVAALLCVGDVFGDAIDPEVKASITCAYELLVSKGAAEAVRQISNRTWRPPNPN